MAENGSEIRELTDNLRYLPSIIGKMGINIAEAQKLMNAEYVKTLNEIVRLYYEHKNNKGGTEGDNKEGKAALEEVLKQLAPPRYQFTESTIEFRADLAESTEFAGSADIGFGMAGVAVGASFAFGYGMDYRATASISSVLHAVQPGTDLAQKLLDRAENLKEDNKPELPDRSKADQALWEQMHDFGAAVADQKNVPKDPTNNGGENKDKKT